MQKLWGSTSFLSASREMTEGSVLAQHNREVYPGDVHAGK